MKYIQRLYYWRLCRIMEEMKLPPRWAILLVLGQSDDGDFYLPCFDKSHHHPEQWWDREYDAYNPAHWPYMAATWLTGWVMWLEGG